MLAHIELRHPNLARIQKWSEGGEVDKSAADDTSGTISLRPVLPHQQQLQHNESLYSAALYLFAASVTISLCSNCHYISFSNCHYISLQQLSLYLFAATVTISLCSNCHYISFSNCHYISLQQLSLYLFAATVTIVTVAAKRYSDSCCKEI